MSISHVESPRATVVLMNSNSSPTAFHTADTFLPFMRDAVRCEQSLRELSLMWRMIEASAKMNCSVEAQAILPTMAATRAGFEHLEQELVTGLVNEKINNVLEEIGTRAQYVIDIVVRNLYERTADVGFLATDRELCAFVAGMNNDEEAIRARLKSYRSKYTVYDEILLLDSGGRVLMQIDETAPLAFSSDPLIAATLTADGFVETFRATDLRPGKRQALIYSRCMLHPDTGVPTGVLCLCFNFEEEMEGIFQSHRDEQARSNMVLVDAQNRVIAAADPAWVPLGSVVPVNHEGTAEPMIFGGREYLVRTHPAAGYQGYMGPPGWQGQVMIPIDIAFHGKRQQDSHKVAPGIAAGLMSHAKSFCPPLHDIMNAAATIRRVVWNGQVMTAGRQGDMLKLQTVLDQISETGSRSDEIFTRSIVELYNTVLSTRMRDTEFVAHLLVDLLDRNLYERSDDCRWWAMTPELGRALAERTIDDKAAQGIAALLEYVNSLYTVYTRLFVYDRQGQIVADSRRDGTASVAGSHIDGATLESVLSLRNEQQYHVTRFVPEPMYEGRPTYVYHAAIRMPGRHAEVVGGIGIVFDSEAELAAMLRGAIAAKSSMSAFFIDREGKIIASTEPAHPIGSQLDIEAAMRKLSNGNVASRIVVHDGQYAAMGCCVSNGYREFKTSDGYRDDVLAVVFHKFGKVHDLSTHIDREQTRIDAASRSQEMEYASFSSNGMLFALPAKAVSEARSAAEISRVSMGGRSDRIGVLSRTRQGGGSEYVWVFDLGLMLFGTPTSTGYASQVLILCDEGREFAVLIDELHDVPKFEPGQITPTPFAATMKGLLVREVVCANEGRLLLQILDVRQLFACVDDLGLPTVLPLEDTV